MIAIARPLRRKSPSTTWHGRFLAMLPDIIKQAHGAFRRESPEAREDLVQHVVAHAFCAFARLVERGKVDLAYPTPLTRYAICRIRSGRFVGTTLASTTSARDMRSRVGAWSRRAPPQLLLEDPRRSPR